MVDQSDNIQMAMLQQLRQISANTSYAQGRNAKGQFTKLQKAKQTADAKGTKVVLGATKMTTKLGKAFGGLQMGASNLKAQLMSAAMSLDPISNFMNGFLGIFSPVGDAFDELGQVASAGLSTEIAQLVQGIMSAVKWFADMSKGMENFWKALDEAGWHLSDFIWAVATGGISAVMKWGNDLGAGSPKTTVTDWEEYYRNAQW